MTMPDPPWDAIGTPAWLAFWETILCPVCGGEGLDFYGPAKDPHFAVWVCDYGCHVGYVKRPPRSVRDEKRRRRYSPLPKHDSDYCRLCLLDREQLKVLGRTLVDGHKIDRAALIDAGLPPDAPENRSWICNRCHELEQGIRRDAARLLDAIQGAA